MSLHPYHVPFPLCIFSNKKHTELSGRQQQKKRNYKKGYMKEKALLLMGWPHQC